MCGVVSGSQNNAVMLKVNDKGHTSETERRDDVWSQVLSRCKLGYKYNTKMERD